MTQGTGQQPTEHEVAHGFRRKMVGRVISAKMQKTVVVEVVDHTPRPALRQVRPLARPLQVPRREERVQGGRPGRDPGAPPPQPRQALHRDAPREEVRGGVTP